MILMEEDTKVLPDHTGIQWLDTIIEIANSITRRIIEEIQQDEDKRINENS